MSLLAPLIVMIRFSLLVFRLTWYLSFRALRCFPSLPTTWGAMFFSIAIVSVVSAFVVLCVGFSMLFIHSCASLVAPSTLRWKLSLFRIVAGFFSHVFVKAVGFYCCLACCVDFFVVSGSSFCYLFINFFVSAVNV